MKKILILVFILSLVPFLRVHAVVHKNVYREVVASDTYWGIASSLASDFDDIRDIEYQIIKSQGNKILQPGDIIKTTISSKTNRKCWVWER